ncbi:MAG: carboxypeptidase-like regulatory domain-containing protein [Balneolaceae bacterium]|nr:carboxypeptidase-like regulatory domain-containing protein [Balneolaceae bacterium]
MNKFGCLLLVSLLLWLMVYRLEAQDTGRAEEERYTLILRGEPLDKALKQLVEQTNIDLIYSPSLLGSRQVFSISRDKPVDEILSDILRNTGLDYVLLSSGTYLLIESAERRAHYGAFTGSVYDKDTGEPLPGANVLLADASTGTSTNSAGRFSIAPLLSDQYEVTISYVGYEAVRDTVWIPGKTRKSTRFYLEARPVFAEPLVISSLQPRIPFYADRGEEITTFTGSGNTYTGTQDALRSLHSVMGTNFSLSMADFHIQGGSMGDHQVLLDGVPVYNPVSLGRLTGAFSPYALEKITIHKAGYGVREGSRISGVVDVQQDLADRSPNNLTLQADPLNMNGRIDLTAEFPNGPSLKTMIAGRTNIWGLYRKPSLSKTLERWDRLDPLLIENLLENSSVASSFRALDHTSEIRFYDLHMRNQLQFNDFHNTTVSLYRGKNYLQTQLLSHNDNRESDVPDFMYTQDGYNWINNIAKLSHDWLIGPRLNATFAVSVSAHRSTHHFAMANSDQLAVVPDDNQTVINRLQLVVNGQSHSGEHSNITETTIRTEFDYSLHRRHSLRIGLESKLVDYTFGLSDPFYHPVASAGKQHIFSGHLEDQISLGYRTALIAGSRFTYIPTSGDIYAEPRLSLQHDGAETAIGTFTGKIAAGIYRQFINQFDITNVGPSAIVPSNRFWVPSDYSTAVPVAYHLNTDLLIEPADRLKIRLEGYYKWQPRSLELDYHTLLQSPGSPDDHFEDQSSFITSGKRYSYGSGISISHLFESIPLEASVMYQFSDSRQRISNRFDNRYVDTPWKIPHRLTSSGYWNITGGLTANIRWQSVWGRSWGYKKAYYDYLTIQENQSVFGGYSLKSPSDDRLSPYHQLDLGFSYGRAINGNTLRLRLQLVNLLDRENILEQQIVPVNRPSGTEYQVRDRSLPGLTPSVSVEYFF